MKIEFLNQPQINLYGYSPDSPSDILAKVSAGAIPSSLKGDFVLVAEGLDAIAEKPLTVFISTIICAVPYFFYTDKSKCFHASNVFDCCQAAELSWQ